ncbi:hypothetical protein [Anaeromicropila herbilytica]|uniref:Uncharacterized protein n=1 Tax=Anaeromicropila herbilytica TaxID=2785025 RepID=A0A7R7ENF3_9FIRM|nr:hypothetical protein [Anaeromicropila herbilytica]BCN32049.1 hypothetical protein bsdtb5_33440 [Anaeromicropila herbilytica]
MQSCDLVASITAVACAISKCSTNEELLVLVSAFGQLSDTLNTIRLQNEFLLNLEKKQKEAEDVNNCTKEKTTPNNSSEEMNVENNNEEVFKESETENMQNLTNETNTEE